ncbi:Putative protein of unknown function [Podospora comata]|uniref:Uncharacterized protein n=1 Tax=Podospora comata TaxID=48703 RepID=A0ABY6RXT7_PODCO|nr:Putative protein of unknown function [Podospora comata]
MAANRDLPDITVAVDYGTTFTGVGWQQVKKPNSRHQIISDWPGYSERSERKVPSVLSKKLFKQPNGQGVRKWGFQCEDFAETAEEDMSENDKWRYLKICLDPDYHKETIGQNFSWAPATMKEVHLLICDYLSHVYCHVKKSISDTLRLDNAKDWDNLSVEFVFSVPTTWEGVGGQKILDDFLKIVKDAGFGSAQRHRVMLGLTEAEAAAVATLSNTGSPLLPFKNGDTLLSIDAGGGTTDLALVRTTKTKPPAMEQIQSVTGIGVGSRLIDLEFQRLINIRLKAHPEEQSKLPLNKLLSLSQSRHYRTVKHRFGETAYHRDYKIVVPGLDPNIRSDGLDIERGAMKFMKEEFRGLFDDQVARILRTLDEVVGGFKEPVQYIILSGGLGSSTYIFNKVKEHIDRSTTRALRKGETQLPRIDDPQLVVVRGLLLEQALGILRKRIARASYGLVTSLPYSKKKHFSEVKRIDEFNRKDYVLDQIRWILKRDTIIDHGKQFEVEVERREDLDHPLQWKDIIVVSSIEARWLPPSMPTQVDLNQVRGSILKKTRSWPLPITKYYVCQYKIRLSVEPSGNMQFEVEYQGKIIPGNHTLLRSKIEVCPSYTLRPVLALLTIYFQSEWVVESEANK